MIFLKDYNQYNLCKDIFMTFVGQLKTKPLNSVEFLMKQRELIANDPALTNYIYQYALSITYEKKILDSREIEAVFNNQFKIKEPYGMNGSDCDISTLNSAIVIDHMKKHTSFKDLPFTIFNAPLEYGTELYYRAQEKPITKEYVMKSKAYTGQPNADIAIGDRIYDIKHTEKTSAILNHLMPWTYERIQNEGYQFLTNQKAILENNKHQMAEDLAKTLEKILQEKKLNIHQKFEVWNQELSANWVTLEKTNIALPIVVQMTQVPFRPAHSKGLHEKIHIKADVLENKLSARKAIYGICEVYGPNYVKNAIEASLGVLNSTLSQDFTDDVD